MANVDRLIEFDHVILSGAKNLRAASRILRSAQNDKSLPSLVGNIHWMPDEVRATRKPFVSESERQGHHNLITLIHALAER